ncbi:hypothetical protein AX17_001090 [Amanita inopinata Kibby_2008]|nr:hypothetical protein AX17_001090 [Amanita inopinata Kibby_2008]
MVLSIRNATERDAPALSRICLLTADAGRSAENLHDHGELPGLVYAVPYVKLPTTWGFVLVDGLQGEEAGDGEVVGYVVGSTDTCAFEQYAAQHWWPILAQKYLSSLSTKPADQRYIRLLQEVRPAPAANLDFADAHMHINMLEDYQRKGWGRKLIDRAMDHLMETGIKGNGVWLGLDPRNVGARQFYVKLGFKEISGGDGNQMGVKFDDWVRERSVRAGHSAKKVGALRGGLHLQSLSRTSMPNSKQLTPSSTASNSGKMSAIENEASKSEPPDSLVEATDRMNRLSELDGSPEEFPVRRVSYVPLAPPYQGYQRGPDHRNASDPDAENDDAYLTGKSPDEHAYRDSHFRFPQDIYTSPEDAVYSKAWNRQKEDHRDSHEDSRDIYRGDSSCNNVSRFRQPLHTPKYSSHGGPERLDQRDRMPSTTFSDSSYTSTRRDMRRADSMVSFASGTSDVYDPDDPRVTGIKSRRHVNSNEPDRETMKNLDYRTRQKLRTRVKIEYNLSCGLEYIIRRTMPIAHDSFVAMEHRQGFLLKLARALMTFGAPSHRIESQLVAAARILEVEAEFIHLPGVMICSFGDQEQGRSKTHFVKCNGKLSLGALHKVHLIYRSVVHDETSAKKAAAHLEALLIAPPLYGKIFRSVLAFLLSALICPLAFGGSLVDMWIAGASAFILSVLQLCVVTKSAMYANVFEITIAILISFTARGLSSIRSQIFCYTAISSAGIVGILPGYLILSSSLELASKNIVCGSVRMVYALIYTLFLGFGLQIGSDFYLLLDPQYRQQLEEMANNISSTISLVGTWVADNTTSNSTVPLVGTWTFVHSIPPSDQDIYEGCYRPRQFPWYLQPFPLWTSFIIVPLFSTLSSLANLQPFWSKQLPVMVIISCCSYASNKIANHFIFNRSDVVSAIGAFTVGVLGNIYSRKMRGTAFTSMVTGVLFLVPSGLSQAGGITANGSGIDIGGAMVAVTIGITVGLFMSQALVYTFGSRKNAAVFSF